MQVRKEDKRILKDVLYSFNAVKGFNPAHDKDRFNSANRKQHRSLYHNARTREPRRIVSTNVATSTRITATAPTGATLNNR